MYRYKTKEMQHISFKCMFYNVTFMLIDAIGKQNQRLNTEGARVTFLL